VERLTKLFAVFECDAHINDPTQIWGYVPESERELIVTPTGVLRRVRTQPGELGRVA
jgi:hypothetical protein